MPQAYYKGYIAFIKGVERTDCPYISGLVQTLWIEGWVDAYHGLPAKETE